MTEKQIKEIWRNRYNQFGYEIGKHDVLIYGAYIENIGLSKRDIENEYLEFDNDSFYLVIGFCNGNFSTIESINDISDIALHYFYA